MRSRKDSGFSLLEIIIVLAIIGGVMVSYAYYARKKAENIAQQNTANALVAEMKGVINFVRDDKIALVKGSPLADKADENSEIVNPLYDDSGSADAGYGWRIENEIDTVDTGSIDNYFLWGNNNNKANQQRYYFLSSNCKVDLKSEYPFDKEYLPCFMSTRATNSAAVIERIGLAGGTSDSNKRNVNRIDVIVKFKRNEKNDNYQFADYEPHFSQALSAAGISASHAMVLHRNTSGENWKLVVQKKDNKTPVEFGTIANNMDALTQYTQGDFGVRFTFDMNDNSNGGSGGGGSDKCWITKDADDKETKLCYNSTEGQGEHGEDIVLSLDLTDTKNENGNQMAGTLKANVVMENTSRRVYMFKRRSGGSLELDGDGKPERYTYTDSEGNPYEGDFVMNDEVAKNDAVPGDSYSGSNYEVYTTRTYDAFELLTPVTSEYHAFMEVGKDVTGETDYYPTYDDSDASKKTTDYGPIRIPVQSCPQIKQNIALRDYNGELIKDENGNTQTVEVIRKLYPHLSAAMSSVNAYNMNGLTTGLMDPSQTRNRLDSSKVISQLAGVTTQIEFTKNNEQYRPGSSGINTGETVVYEDSKYLWIISASVGLYDGDTGKGATLVNPPDIAYTVSRWCSSVPQKGTPADLLETYQYK
ncbi:type II secretion system protein [Salmonella enterica]|uniref:type II secretion system protein n=1 Tax=Salmonella enterica TaxID=28901 RepID=UPI000DA2CFBD|nr:type II secretion system protein [Salmonella enterica]ECF6030401.1 type II secretion system protein [Salmonella enterica subsp. salamae serovar Greenside]ECJ6093452.1 type II secretion system protein [Salmonella enterica]SQI52665.1 type IV pilin [Salmonella enterica subsp. salamae serovar Greenside]HAO4183729.1 type II secretion system protein [Salmonella enterica]